MNTQHPLVFITGASAGIGAAAVRVFALAGFDVVLTARRKERLEQLVSALKPDAPNAVLLPLSCDVTSDDSVQAAFNTVKERFGKLDVLVNNAGYGVYGQAAATPLSEYRANMETNYFGMIRCTQAALPHLRAAAAGSKKRWGATIVMISSFVGRRAMPLMSSYSATKFAMEGYSEALRVELFDERIAVSVVNPGATRTEFGNVATGDRPAEFMSFESGMSAETVARVILCASQKPCRNRYLTAAGKAGMAVQWSMPAVLDRVLLQTYRKAMKGGGGKAASGV